MAASSSSAIRYRWFWHVPVTCQYRAHLKVATKADATWQNTLWSKSVVVMLFTRVEELRHFYILGYSCSSLRRVLLLASPWLKDVDDWLKAMNLVRTDCAVSLPSSACATFLFPTTQVRLPPEGMILRCSSRAQTLLPMERITGRSNACVSYTVRPFLEQ